MRDFYVKLEEALLLVMNDTKAGVYCQPVDLKQVRCCGTMLSGTGVDACWHSADPSPYLPVAYMWCSGLTTRSASVSLWTTAPCIARS